MVGVICRRHFSPKKTARNAFFGFPNLGVGTGLGTALTVGTKRIAQAQLNPVRPALPAVSSARRGAEIPPCSRRCTGPTKAKGEPRPDLCIARKELRASFRLELGAKVFDLGIDGKWAVPDFGNADDARAWVMAHARTTRQRGAGLSECFGRGVQRTQGARGGWRRFHN